jgi:hypothetical protein
MILLAWTVFGLVVTRDADAFGPIGVEVAAEAGGGTNPFSGLNPLGLGLGVRGGVTFAGLYGGLALSGYSGSSRYVPPQGGGFDLVSGSPLPGERVSESAVMYGLEGGYGRTLFDGVTLRLQLGVGDFQVNTSGAVSGRTSNLYVEPGLIGLVSFGALFVGGDVRVLVLPDVADPNQRAPSAWKAAFTAHGQVGISF